MAPTVEKGLGGWTGEEGNEAAPQDVEPRVDGQLPCVGSRSGASGAADGGWVHYDEEQRARLMADIMRLIREPSMPPGARTAGMTLVGWLARRRPDEIPHAIGVEEARESERRIRAARAKAR